MSGRGGARPGGRPAARSGRSASGSSGSAGGCGITILIVLVTLAAIIFGVLQEEGTFADSGPDFEDGAFSATDSARLVQRLEAASKVQKICYGWEIDTDRTFSLRPAPLPTIPPSAPSSEQPSLGTPDGPLPTAFPESLPAPPTRSGLGVDVGSNLGVGVDPRQVPASCPKWVVFTAAYDWSFIDEVQKLESFGVESNVEPMPTPTIADLNAAGITQDTLKREDAPARLADAVSTLPLIMSEKAGAGSVPEPSAAAPAPNDTAQGNGFPTALLIGGLLVAGGLVWISIAFVRSRRRRPNNLEGLTDVR